MERVPRVRQDWAASHRVERDRLRRRRESARHAARVWRASVPTMTPALALHHFHEAARSAETASTISRCGSERCGADPPLVAKLRAIDFYFLNLNQLQTGNHRRPSANVSARTRGGDEGSDRAPLAGVSAWMPMKLRSIDTKRSGRPPGRSGASGSWRWGLAGKRIVHVNSTRTGGGVAEILRWMIP